MKTLLWGFTLLFTLLLFGCTAEPEQITVVETKEVPVTVEVTNEIEVTREVVAEATRLVEVEVTRLVEETVFVEVTQTPPPPPTQFVNLEGTGDSVSDNFEVQECQKAVFSWTAVGQSNFIVYLWKVGIDDNRLLVNEIAPSSGETLQPLTGGTYWLTIDSPTESWSITAECRE